MDLITDLWPKLPGYFMLFCQSLGALALIATVVVRITPSEKDDIAVGKFTSIVFKFLSWLPTIGVNPRTQKLEKAQKELTQ